MKNNTFIFRLLIICTFIMVANPLKAETRKHFIHKYKQIAIREMERTGIPASITLAQGILESGCGKSELAVNANNHFGIKCHNWEGDSYTMDDDTKDECFRKYGNPEDSWVDHSEFLISRPRYAGLFNLKTTDYRAWAKGLKAAGYATNPQYADLLIKIIEEEELHKFDREITKQNAALTEASIAPTVAVKKTQAQASKSSYRNREEIRNGVICIESIAGDSFDKIAAYYGIKLKKLLEYNDQTTSDLKPGQLVYVARKKSKAARGYEFHRVKAGETLYDIAQHYGVRMKNLVKYNYLSSGSSLMEGEKLSLRKKNDLI